MAQYYLDTFQVTELNIMTVNDLNIFKILPVSIYNNFPPITGTSPILINQVNTIKPQGYNVPGTYTADYGSEPEKYRKDICICPTDMINSTQRFTNRM